MELKEVLDAAYIVLESKVTLLVVLMAAIWWMNRKINKCEKKHNLCELRLARALQIIVKLTTAERMHDQSDRRREDPVRAAIFNEVHLEAASLLREIEVESAVELQAAA